MKHSYLMECKACLLHWVGHPKPGGLCPRCESSDIQTSENLGAKESRLKQCDQYEQLCEDMAELLQAYFNLSEGLVGLDQSKMRKDSIEFRKRFNELKKAGEVGG